MGRKMDVALQAAWRSRLKRFEGSSLTVAEFCRREGVSQGTFYQWRKRLRHSGARAPKRRGGGHAAGTPPVADATSGRAAFVPVSLAAAAVVEIELPNGTRVRVPADREQALLAAIRAAGGLTLGEVGTLAQEAPSC
jgi:transposase-like protein